VGELLSTAAVAKTKSKSRANGLARRRLELKGRSEPIGVRVLRATDRIEVPIVAR